MLFYLYTATSGPRVGTVGHNDLAEAFEHGQLHLLIKPDPRLLALPDPWDPQANSRYRAHDLVLYNGRYYFYWGPSALLLYLPARFFFGPLKDPIACAIFSAIGFLGSVWLFQFLARKVARRIPLWAEALGILTLGLCSIAPFLIRRGVVYEVAIACGFAYLLQGLNLLARGLFDENSPRSWHLAGASLLLGLGVGARPHYIVYCGFLLIALTWLWRTNRLDRGSAVALIAPVAVCGLLLAGHNYARFGSITEFGVSWHLPGFVNMRHYQQIHFGRVLPNLFYNLFQPLGIQDRFPYFFPGRLVRLPVPQPFLLEPVTGIIPLCPFILLLIFLPFSDLPKRNPAIARALLLMPAMGFLLLLSMSTLFGSTMRYLVDFLPLFLVSTLVFWIYLLGEHRWRFMTMVIVPALMVYSMTVGFAYSFIGPGPHYTPAWVERVMANVVRYATGRGVGPIEMEVAFPPFDGGPPQPILSTGSYGASDLIFAKYVDTTHLCFCVDHFGTASACGSVEPFIPGQFYKVRVDMPSLWHGTRSQNYTAIYLNGKEVLRTDLPTFAAGFSEVITLRNGVQATTARAEFTGTSRTVQRVRDSGNRR
ncbi:MAG TPA: hypothetical protein VE621_03900 [Bryobacteraceae bacterium]|nr:hypothetical protein [Bryobacteraceae bacterium]